MQVNALVKGMAHAYEGANSKLFCVCRVCSMACIIHGDADIFVIFAIAISCGTSSALYLFFI